MNWSAFDPTQPVGRWRTASRTLTKTAGFGGFCFHALRHTAISALGEAGVPDRVIMDIASHVSPRTLRRYSHIQLEAKRTAVEALCVSFESSGQEVVFLSSEQNTGNTVRARVDVEGQNYRGANVTAQSVIQPVLDAVSFSTGTALLVQHWDFVIKSEPSSATRTALWCDLRKEPAPRPLTRDEIDETRQILGQAGESLELCWHRYAIQRSLVIDRFVFQSLAFEALAGNSHMWLQ